MRDVYYQSVGNPLQADRLPLTRPTIELVPAVALRNPGTTLLQAAGVSVIISTVILFLYQAPGFSFLDPYDLLLSIPVIMTGLSVSLLERDLKHIFHPCVLVAIGVACLNHRIPSGIHVLVVAVGAGLLVYQFGTHSVAMITTRPMPFAATAMATAVASRSLRGISGLTAIVTAAALAFGGAVPNLLAWTFPLFILSIAVTDGLKRHHGGLLVQNLISWVAYEPDDRPGLLKSPAGSQLHRVGSLYLATQLTAMTLLTWDGSPLPIVENLGKEHHIAVKARLEASDAGRLERWKHQVVTSFCMFSAIVILPAVLPISLAMALVTPVIVRAAAAAEEFRNRNLTRSIIDDIPLSPDRIERNSVYMGSVLSDGSPMLVPRRVFTEHAHGLGDSGSGKTSLFLCPLIEQLMMSGDCSVIVIDLKADSLELLATQMAVAERLERERGLKIPVKIFSNQPSRPSLAFNPMTQSFWENFDLLTRTDILCGANGLTYGTDYGAGYYSSANAAVLYSALKAFPQIRTFQELAECIGTVITTAKKQELHPEIRKAGVHVQEVIKRLASCAPLNVTSSTGHDPEVIRQSIDLTQPFLEPQMLYFHLSATLSPSGAPEIGRLVNYILLAASTQVQRKHQVFLVIDEFQRMVAGNLEYMLQLARSMGVGVILANQSMEDLKRSSVNLIPPIEANCRLRQWFSVSSLDDRDRLIRSSGEAVDITYTRNYNPGAEPEKRYSYSESERVVPRLTVNDILLMSDHPFRSVVRISRGDGYAQYGGFPVIIESGFHISEREYQRRRAMPWPTLPGMFTPGSQRPANSVSVTSGPIITEEVIGSGDPSSRGLTPDAINEFLDDLKKTIVPAKPRRKKKGSP
jgi:hypothetical protein